MINLLLSKTSILFNSIN